MINFLHKRARILFICFFILLTCTACSSPRARDGKVKVDQIISSEEIKIKKKDVNTTDISDAKLKKKYAKLDKNDYITVEPTTFNDALSNGWFDGLIVWPMAALINKVAESADAGMGIIVTTVIIQVALFLLTSKSQMSSQRMQEVQPEIQAIQDKYRGKTDQQSQMAMYQETQAIYQKYDIHPFGSMLVMFLQLPIMMGMYYATMRAASVIYGNFLGMNLSTTPMQGIRGFIIPVLVVYALMIVTQLVSSMLPQWMQKHREKIKEQNNPSTYKKQENPMGNTMNMYMYMMTIMFAFIYVSWPIAMSFYWLVTSIIRIIQQIILHKRMMKTMNNNQNQSEQGILERQRNK